MAFSNDGQFYAAVVEGQLKVWTVADNTLKLSRPDSLQNPYTCFAWAPVAIKRKSKKKVAVPAGAPPAELAPQLALGTLTGHVCILDVATGHVSTLSEQHGDQVNALAWRTDRQRLFSGSSDQHIAEWDVATEKQSRSWVADKRAVTALVFVDQGLGGLIVSAASKIKVWDLATGEESIKFSGHAYAVGSLTALPLGGVHHIVSAVHNHSDDLQVTVWPLSRVTGAKPKPVATFGLTSCPVAVAAGAVGEAGVIAVVDGAGAVQLCTLVASAAPSRTPVATITIVSAPGAVAVPVLAVLLPPDQALTHCLLAYGRPAAPVFETLSYAPAGTPVTVELSRTLPVVAIAGTRSHQQGLPVAHDDKKSADSVVLGAGDAGKVSASKRKKLAAAAVAPETDDDDEIALGEKIKTLLLDADDAGDARLPQVARAKGAPTAGSLVHMLAQALQSNDNALLEECLAVNSETVINNTIARLPPQLVVQFLTAVVHKLEAKPSRGLALLAWIRSVLLVHSAFLLSVPNLAQMLAGLYSLIDTRIAVYPRILKLHGRLELIFSQIALRGGGGDLATAESIPLPENSYTDAGDDDDEGAVLEDDNQSDRSNSDGAAEVHGGSNKDCLIFDGHLLQDGDIMDEGSDDEDDEDEDDADEDD